MNPQETIQAVYQVSSDLRREQIALKQFEADLEDRASELPSYNELQEAKELVKALKRKLKLEAMQDASFTAAQDNVMKIRSDVKDLKDILSLHLARYFTESGGEMLPVEGEPGSMHPITITARLGGKVKLNKRE